MLLFRKWLYKSQSVFKAQIRQRRVTLAAYLRRWVNMYRSNYSKVEAGERKLSVAALNKVAKHFGMTLDEHVNFKGKVPTKEKIEDKAMVFRLIDTIVTKKKFKDFVATMQ